MQLIYFMYKIYIYTAINNMVKMSAQTFWTKNFPYRKRDL